MVVGGDFGVFTQLPLRKGGANKHYVYVKPISLSWKKRGKRVWLGRMAVITKKLVYISIQSGLAKVTTCLLACQAYWRHSATGQKQLLHKDTPSKYFQWQHTIWWPLWRVRLHEWNTSSLRGNDSHRLQQLNNSNNIVSYHKESAVDVSEPDLFFSIPFCCSRPQTYK